MSTWVVTIIRTCNFWVTWLRLMILINSFLCISDIRYKPESLCRRLIWREFAFLWSQGGPSKDEDLLFLSFWTNFREKWGVPLNILLILVVLLYSWEANVGTILMITEAYLEPSITMKLFVKIVNGRKLLTISIKRLHRRCLMDFRKILLNSSQCLKRINKGSWVSWTLITWLRHYELFYFESFTQVGVMSDERHELSTEWRTSGKLL